ncbi:bifunctional DNA-formamidopyrimidine glycosylase/DNA-(apurinic or apyrimidinic site) lyase [Pseudonocardia spinosispora]|uniref:bifunctional DNA-formamidopyrimidine glycosylase/DNA-(apurinic or apyrimidinic site) lyase n=1 Tax=Pseudonocardia spinosispora TaxID=103441 RepID=UPI000405293F|nr:bifunctional DNA-formamidopyrimidine glycosylase/DNA-(apurinic or apyrimidinic site) lyase [Pseudonocardia spinosispora]
MPELPEVEVVRRGLAEHVIGRKVAAVEVLHPRAVRRHVAGAADVIGRLTGRTLSAARRRGKYLWLELDSHDGPADAMLAHLGMSGQMLVTDATTPPQKHLRVLLSFTDGGPQLRFVDQRTFGGVSIEHLVGEDEPLPESIAHIARDPMDPAFDVDAVVAAMRRKRTELKRALLDQSLVSGIGNIYADEALWRARLHGNRPTATLTRKAVRAVLASATEVMGEALDQGGTSFDALYVNVNGNSGYFDRSLNVYGQEDRPCRRCGTAIRRISFMNRSSYFCPRCQPRPRATTS